jgi:hypothetical protein
MPGRTWEEREIPILEAIVDANESGSPIEDLDALTSIVGITRGQVEVAVELLIDDDYVQAPNASQMGRKEWLQLRPTPRAMRVIGSWPLEPFAEIVAVLDELIAAEPDAAKRSGLEKVRDGFLEVGPGVATSVISSFAQRALEL